MVTENTSRNVPNTPNTPEEKIKQLHQTIIAEVFQMLNGGLGAYLSKLEVHLGGKQMTINLQFSTNTGYFPTRLYLDEQGYFRVELPTSKGQQEIIRVHVKTPNGFRQKLNENLRKLNQYVMRQEIKDRKPLISPQMLGTNLTNLSYVVNNIIRVGNYQKRAVTVNFKLNRKDKASVLAYGVKNYKINIDFVQGFSGYSFVQDYNQPKFTRQVDFKQVLHTILAKL